VITRFFRSIGASIAAVGDLVGTSAPRNGLGVLFVIVKLAILMPIAVFTSRRGQSINDWHVEVFGRPFIEPKSVVNR